MFARLNKTYGYEFVEIVITAREQKQIQPKFLVVGMRLSKMASHVTN